MSTRKSYGDGFDRTLGRTDGTRFRRWYDATSRVPAR